MGLLHQHQHTIVQPAAEDPVTIAACHSSGTLLRLSDFRRPQYGSVERFRAQILGGNATDIGCSHLADATNIGGTEVRIASADEVLPEDFGTALDGLLGIDDFGGLLSYRLLQLL